MYRGTWFDLTGKVALVTGAGKGIGKAIAGALARAGADVAITSRTLSDLEALKAEIEPLGGRVHMVVADVSEEEAIREMTARVLEHFGRIDILVNNAGIEGQGKVVEMDAALWDRVLNVNLRAPMLCCKYVGPHMIKRHSGKVINVASVLATRVARGLSPYTSSKGGLVQFTRTLALEWLRYNIQVNALCPGYFLTPMNEKFFATARGKEVIESFPIKRLGRPEELEGAAVFLASEATSFVTGISLYVDGGHSLA